MVTPSLLRGLALGSPTTWSWRRLLRQTTRRARAQPPPTGLGIGDPLPPFRSITVDGLVRTSRSLLAGTAWVAFLRDCPASRHQLTRVANALSTIRRDRVLVVLLDEATVARSSEDLTAKIMVFGHVVADKPSGDLTTAFKITDDPMFLLFNGGVLAARGRTLDDLFASVRA